jgi:class 3 adenylate cyclase
MSGVNEALLDERLATLEKARAWSPRLVSKLESLIRGDDEDALFRINPMSFSKAKGLDDKEVTDLFLHATVVGLFDMDWLLECPACSCVIESFRNLSGVCNHFRCRLCQVEYDVTLDDFIAVTFTINRQIREIALHRPEQLSAEDLLFKVGGTRDGLLPDGTPFIDAQRSALQKAFYLAPDETVEFDVEADQNWLFGGSSEGHMSFLFPVEGDRREDVQRIELDYGGERDSVLRRTVAPGRIHFAVHNVTPQRGVAMILAIPPGTEVGTRYSDFAPFLNGKKLVSHQTFRDLFHGEVVRAGDGLAVKDISLLFTDLKGSTALYDRIGDLNAFALVQQHFEKLQAVTVRNNGAVVKTIGDAVMAAFVDPADAVRAALAMRKEIASFNASRGSRQIILKIGIHRGPAIAVTLNGRLDYFGQTVNIAARVQALADADQIYLSDQIYAAPGVGAALAGLPIAPQTVSLRGVHDAAPVYLVGASEAASALAAQPM